MEKEFQGRRWGSGGSGGEQEPKREGSPMPWFLPHSMVGIPYAELFENQGRAHYIKGACLHT